MNTSASALPASAVTRPQLDHKTGTVAAASGVDWAQAIKIGYSLRLSPMAGFGCAALLSGSLYRLF